MSRWNLESLTNRQGITYAESNLITWFYSQFDNNAAGSGLNRHIANVEPLYFHGASALTEFFVYAATKLYLCLEFTIAISANPIVPDVSVSFYDEGNVWSMQLCNNALAYNTGGIPEMNYIGNNIDHKNFYFSRITNIGYDFIKFNGFRITLD